MGRAGEVFNGVKGVAFGVTAGWQSLSQQVHRDGCR